MKKILLFILLLLLIASAILIYFLRTKSGMSSIYLVPDNAVMIVETKDPLKAWDKIVHSNAWNHYSKNEFFVELNNEILSYDSIVNSSKFFLKLIGEKPVIISQHPIGNNKYDFLYVIEAGKIAEYKNPAKLVSTALGSNYEISTREYKSYKILEVLDKEDKEYFFMAFVHGKLIFSWIPKLVEQSLDASETMLLGRDLAYLNVKSKISNNGLFSVYLVHKNLNKFVAALSPEARESFKNSTRGMLYTGISFDIDPGGKIELEGYSSLADTATDTYFDLLSKGSVKMASSNVIPDRIASLVNINFDDAGEYVEKSMKTLSDADYKEYTSNIKMVEKHLKINLEDNLYSWMDKEIVLLQTQPSNLGRSNEFAAIVHTSDSADAAKNLHFVWRQIKKNSPVKIKTVNYKGYPINYVAFPGIIKVLFGKALKKIEKPYITQAGDNIIISNHPQTIKNIIDDYLEGKTLNNSGSYSDFTNEFSDNTSIWIYVEPAIFYQNLKALVNNVTWQKIQKNKQYITCFDQAGLQINKSGDLLHFTLKTQYKVQAEDWKMPFYNSSEMIQLFNYAESADEDNKPASVEKDTVPEIFISDFDAKKYEEFYDDGTLKLSVEVKDGLKDGDLRVYYPSGELKIKGKFKDDHPSGKWKYYTEDGDVKKVDEY